MTPTLWTTALSDLLNILAGIVCLALGVEIKTHL